MKTLSSLITGTLICALAVLPVAVSGAMAQSNECTCSTPLQGNGLAVGSITSANGEVLVSASTGYGNAQSGQSLFLGSQVMTGADGVSSLVVGSCQLSVPQNSTLSVSKLGQNICLKIKETSGAAPLNDTTIAVIAGTVVIGGGIGLAIALDKNGVSK